MTPNSPACPECDARLPAEAPLAPCPRCLLLRGFESVVEPSPTSTVHLVLPDDAVLATQPLREQFGNYELLAEIGRGGMGVIYQARQRMLDRIVAVKLIRSGTLARKEDIARFKVEAAATARLRHPGIVAIHEVGEHEGRHFYSMDFVPGRSLAEALRDGPFAPRRAAGCVRAVAEAIHYAHDSGVLHRDLKPSNILLDAEGEPHVTDFGLAKLLHHESELTLTGAVLGSPNYMPPEQARGQHAETSVRSDVYSLGAILYECLTGRPPFTAATPLETMKLVVEQEPIAPRVLNPTLPRDLETICLKCLAKEPSARYATARELADELGRFLADEPIRARPAGFVERTARWCRRKPALAALFGVSLAAAVTLIAVLGSSNTRVRRALTHAVNEGERASNALVRAEAETRRAETNAFVNRLNLYAAKMYLANRAWAEGNTYQARRTLEELAPRDRESDLRGFEWRWLWKVAGGEQSAIWTGHSNAVLCLALSPDGTTLASGGRDAQLRLWDAQTGAERGAIIAQFMPDRSGIGVLDFVNSLSLPSSRHVINSVDFTRDGRLVVAGCGSSAFYNVASMEKVFMQTGERSSSSRLLPETRLLVGLELAEKSSLRLYDWGKAAVGRLGAAAAPILGSVAGLERLRVLTNLPPVYAVSPRGGLWASCTWSNGLFIWRGADEEPVHHLLTRSPASALAFSPDGKRLAVATTKPELELHDLTSNQAPAVFAVPGRIATMVWSPDGRQLAMAGQDQAVSLWDSTAGHLIRRHVGHLGAVNAVVFSKDGRRLFSGGDDGSIRVWKLDAPNAEIVITNSMPPHLLSPDGRSVIGRLIEPSVARHHGRVCWWNVDTGGQNILFDRTSLPAFFTGNGLELGTFTYQGSNQSLRVDFMQPDGMESRPSAWIEGRRGSASRAQSTRIEFRFWLLPSATANQHKFAFSPDGRFCVVPHSDDVVQIWNPTNGQLVAEFNARHDWPLDPRISRDNRWLALSQNSSWEVWSLTERRQVWARNQKTGGKFHSAVFTTEPPVMYFGGEGTDIRRVDLRTGEDLPSLVGHEETVVALALSPDERTLVSGGGDRQLKFWHIATGLEVANRRLEQGVLRLEFSPDNERLAVLEANQSLRLLPAPKPK